MNEQKQPRDQEKLKRTVVFPLSTVVFALCVLAFYLISNLPALSSFVGKIMGVLSPVIGGLALAYLCNPILRFLEHHPLRRIKSLYVRRMLSIFLTYLFLILVVALLGIIIIPQFIHSVKELFANFDDYIANTVTYLNRMLSSIMGNISGGGANEFLSLEKINALLDTLISSLSGIFDVLTQYIGTYGSKLISGAANVILALFISFYVLASKEKRVAQIKKITAAVLNEKQNKFLYETASLANNAFGGFIGGKILDAVVVGIVEYIVFSIFRIPYAPMLACVMGMTNVIPFFGPIIGAVPAGFIVFISDPAKLIPFVIITLVIQQVDGNIIEPRILGERTGVSSLCVIIAISVMGNLWGVAGMIIGVPLFAVVIALVEQYINARLSARGKSCELDDYYVPEPDYVEAIRQGKAHLSKRYYLEKTKRFFMGKKAKKLPPLVREDFMIYPPEPHAEAPAVETVQNEPAVPVEDKQQDQA